MPERPDAPPRGTVLAFADPGAAMPVTFTQSTEAGYLLHSTTVSAITRISPSFLRITLSGPTLELCAETGWDQRVKMILPLPDSGFAHLPTGDQWYADWRLLPDAQRNPMRTYTIRAVRRELGEVDIDFALHGRAGPSSEWALDAEVGSEVVLYAPNHLVGGTSGIDFLPPADTQRYLVVGDETALPAIASILECLPPEAKGVAVVEVPHADDARALGDGPEGVRVIVLARDGAAHGEALSSRVVEVVDELLDQVPDRIADAGDSLDEVDVDTQLLWEVPVDDAGRPVRQETALYAWLAGEASVIKALRRHLVSVRGVDRKAVAFMGYWRLGRAEDNR